MHTSSVRQALALLAVAVLTLAGCGGAPADPGGGAAAPQGAAFPVTVTHMYGSTVIPAEPQRVVTVGGTDHDPVLALGVTPAAVISWRGMAFRPWNEGRIGPERPVEMSDMSSTISVEEVAAQDPDLILALWSNISEQEYAQLSQIAPVVAPDAAFPRFGTPWQMTTRAVGQALGRTAEAEDVVAGTEARIAAVRAANPALEGRKVVVAADFGTGIVLITPPDDVRYGLLRELGLDTDVPGLEGVETLSVEDVGRLDAADVVVWLVLPDATIRENPVYLSQPVHTEGRDIFPGGDTGVALTYASVLSIPYTMDVLVPQLVAAVDRDPATAVVP